MSKVSFNKKTDTLVFDKSLSRLTGMDYIHADGTVCSAGNYSVCYEIKNRSEEVFSKLLSLLRYYCIKFKVIQICEKKENYLILMDRYENLKAAVEDIKMIEEDIEKNIYSAISRLNLRERMQLMQSMANFGIKYDIAAEYTKNGDWVSDIIMSGKKEQETAIIYNNVYGKKYYSVSYAADLDYNVLDSIDDRKKNGKVKYIIMDFADISDYGVKVFFDSLYLGKEAYKSGLETKYPALYDVLFNRKKDFEDKRLFTFMGVYLVEESDSPEPKDIIDENIFKRCRGFNKKMFTEACLPNGKNGLKEMRLCETDKAFNIAADNRII